MKRFLFLMVLLLSSCAQLPPLPKMSASQLVSWHVNGRIAISTHTDSWTANVFWQQQGPVYEIRLNMPLGQGVMSLRGDDKGVVMRTANNKTFTARDPDVLVAQVLKLYIPVTALHSWIRGIPVSQPSPQWYTFDEAGRLHRLRQNGWEIVYKRYIKVQGFDLPNKIFLENDRFQIKIVIYKWDIILQHLTESKNFLL
jgi:outer membrane lipoprotein LolB